MKNFFLMFAFVILAGAGCGASAPATPPPSPPVAPPAPPPAKTEPSDVRVSGLKAVGNAAGNVTAQGCDGPRVDIVVTVQNFGPDFPDAEGLSKVKVINDAQQGQFGSVPWEETALFSVSGEVDFAGKVASFSVPVRPGDLEGGKLAMGQSLDLKTGVQAPCCDPLPATMKLKASIQQSSSLIPTGPRGMKEPYEQEAELALPDVTPGHGQLYIKDGKGTVMVGLENIGKAPTAGPVSVQVTLPRKGSAFASAIWEGKYDQPFTGTVSIGPLHVQDITGEPDRSKVELRVSTLCPSEAYDPIHDANPQNNFVTREVSTSTEAPSPQ